MLQDFLLTDDRYSLRSIYRERAKRCGVWSIARMMYKKGYPLEVAVQWLAAKV